MRIHVRTAVRADPGRFVALPIDEPIVEVSAARADATLLSGAASPGGSP